ncbi:MAG TPA: acyl carrier protein [Cytophagaceae bacterium]|jgi:acyl carrier protein|nr:acyl carrier protein [Cytophagaceae bacterium]
MKTNEFIDKLKESLEIEDIQVSPTTELKSLEGYDSLSILSLIALIDENFDTSLTANQFKSLTTVQSLIDLIGKEHFTE